MVVRTFRDLIAWQKAMDFAKAVYQATGNFPENEIGGLRAQVRAAALSVPANIAEGHQQTSTNEFHRFLSIASEALRKSNTHLLLSERLGYLTHPVVAALVERAEEVARLINDLLDSLRPKIES